MNPNDSNKDYIRAFLDSVEKLAPFIAQYPDWFKIGLLVWGAFTAVLLVGFFVFKLPPSPPPDPCASLAPAVKPMAELRDWAIKANTVPRLSKDISLTRAKFVAEWQRTDCVAKHYEIPPEIVSQALQTQIQICRDEEAGRYEKPHSHEWADEAVKHFSARAEWKEWLIEALIRKLRVYYEQVQAESADAHSRKTAIDAGFMVVGEIKPLLETLSTNELDVLTKPILASFFRISSALRYEYAKPTDGNDTNWNVAHLKIALEDANRSAEYEPTKALVSRLRVLSRLYEQKESDLVGRIEDEINVAAKSVEELLRGSAPDSEVIPPLNNFAVLVHTYVSNTYGIDTNKLTEKISFHREKAIFCQQRVVALCDLPNAWPDAVARKGDFLFDLARMYALQATMKKVLAGDSNVEPDLTAMENQLLRIDQDKSVPSQLRRRLFEGLLQPSEFQPYLERPRLNAIVSYARANSGH